jgi:hypothetical protein
MPSCLKSTHPATPQHLIDRWRQEDRCIKIVFIFDVIYFVNPIMLASVSKLNQTGEFDAAHQVCVGGCAVRAALFLNAFLIVQHFGTLIF